MVQATSSNIKSYDYSADRQVLTVEFTSGAKWEYFNVPARVFQEMQEAESTGQYFAASVKSTFSGAPVVQGGQPEATGSWSTHRA